MIINIPLIVNLHNIHQRKQKLVDINLGRTNTRHIEQYHDSIGDRAMEVEHDPTKLDAKKRDSFPIGQVLFMN